MCNFPKYVLTKDWDTDKRNYKLVEVPIDPSGVAGIEPTGSLTQEGWRPIETAPKDGTWILLTGGKIDYGWDGKTDPPVVSGQYTSVFNGGPCWQFAWYDCGYYGQYEKPTHWQPLPPSPLT